jgi:ribosomal protein S4
MPLYINDATTARKVITHKKIRVNNKIIQYVSDNIVDSFGERIKARLTINKNGNVLNKQNMKMKKNTKFCTIKCFFLLL